MRRKIHNFFYLGRQFRKEFRKQLRLIIVVTLAFTIAFTWRQTVFDLSQTFVQFFTHIEGSATLSVLTSLLITIISVILIMLTSYLLREKDDHYHN